VQYLAEQIEIHQHFAMLQMQMQAAQMHLQNAIQAKAQKPASEAAKEGQASLPSDNSPQTAGQQTQQMPQI
jgi:hypothetical protein